MKEALFFNIEGRGGHDDQGIPERCAAIPGRSKQNGRRHKGSERKGDTGPAKPYRKYPAERAGETATKEIGPLVADH